MDGLQEGAEIGEEGATQQGGPQQQAAQAQQVTEIATGVRRESIESALDAIEEKYPSFEEYLRAEFEIGAAELEDIRARYLV